MPGESNAAYLLEPVVLNVFGLQHSSFLTIRLMEVGGPISGAPEFVHPSNRKIHSTNRQQMLHSPKSVNPFRLTGYTEGKGMRYQ